MWCLSFHVEPKMAFNLYATLGIDRSASKAEVHKAYRRSAKHAHPDTGGSPEAFHRVRTALLVLSDDVRRQRYDATGEFDDGNVVDNREASLLEALAFVVDSALAKTMQGGINPKTADMMAMMRQVCRELQGKLNSEIVGFKTAIQKFEMLKGRFTVSGEGVNRVEKVITGKITQLEFMVSSATQRRERFEEIWKMLDDYEYQRDVSQPTSALELMQRAMQNMQGLGGLGGNTI